MAKYGQKELCKQLNQNDQSLVECIIAKDRLECLRHLNNSVADFAVLHPEELIIANKTDVNIRITHELQKFRNVENDYSVIGLVNYKILVESLEDLKGAKMCNVGFDMENAHEFGWNEIFSKFIEDQFVPQNCNSNFSLLENRIESLEKFVGPSCKAGKWSLDPQQDYMLKQKYPGLCSLCDNPTTCSKKDKYWGRRGVAYCMTDCLGDVAWLRLDDWKAHIQTELSPTCSEFFFLCPDGNVKLSSDPNPCTWISQPLPVIASREEISHNVWHVITNVTLSMPSDDNSYSWKYTARSLISPYSRYVVELGTMYLPSYYLSKTPSYLLANEDVSECESTIHAIRYCIQTDIEFSKCQRMADVAQTFGIFPFIKCVQHEDCADALKKKRADVMCVRTDDFASAMRTNHNLKTILYQFDNSHRYSIAVVKKSSHIHSFEQLRGKRACFGKFDDMGWNSLVYQLIREDLLPKICPYEEALKYFFKDICAVYSTNHNVVRQCDDKFKDEYLAHPEFIEAEVLECLFEGGGDVAFVDLKYLHARMEHEWYFKSSEYEYQRLCSTKTGINGTPYNTSCFMFWSSHGQILVSANISVAREQEITNTFKSIELYFGETVKTSGTPAESFKLFDEFDGHRNVLFQENTKSFGPRIMMQDDTNLEQNYEKATTMYAACNVHRRSPNSATAQRAHYLVTGFTALFIFKLVSS